MTVITATSDLTAFCSAVQNTAVLYLDTEFLRETTYYAKLCLIQAKIPGMDPVAIDVLAEGIDLAPFWALMDKQHILKVFHAGRQDLEIIYQATGKLPSPLFDTQIAASVLGYGDQVGFEGLVRRIVEHQLDKGSQFTDWSRRPLTDRQLRYALDDVRYLEPVYQALINELETKGRTTWIQQDMKALGDPRLYDIDAHEVWRRIKIRSDKPRDLAMLQALAAWREQEARTKNVPRNRVMKDETLVEIALHAPRNDQDLAAIRGLEKGILTGKRGERLRAAIQTGLDIPDADCPHMTRKKPLSDDQELLLDLLKVLVRMRARDIGVSSKMLASTDDLEQLVRNGFEYSPLSSGWRFDALGQELMNGKRFAFDLDIQGRTVRIV